MTCVEERLYEDEKLKKSRKFLDLIYLKEGVPYLDLVRASVDRRGQKVSGGAYRNDDYYRMRIVMCLFANKELNRSQMLTNSEFGLNRMERGRLTLLLEKMLTAGWINSFSTKYSQHIITYSLDEKGLSMAKTIQEFNEKHPIFDLESFNAIKLLGLQDA